MKIRQEVLNRLNNTRGFALIMLAIDCSHSAARDYVKNNSDNLTKAAMLKAIREEFGLDDSQILEESVESVNK